MPPLHVTLLLHCDPLQQASPGAPQAQTPLTHVRLLPHADPAQQISPAAEPHATQPPSTQSWPRPQLHPLPPLEPPAPLLVPPEEVPPPLLEWPPELLAPPIVASADSTNPLASPGSVTVPVAPDGGASLITPEALTSFIEAQ
jgi:hypothetical protein